MNKKILIVAGVIVLVLIFFSFSLSQIMVTEPKNLDRNYEPDEMIDITNETNFLFKAYAKKDAYTIENGKKTWNLVIFELDPDKSEIYKEIGNLDGSENAVVIAPVFTASAYKNPGFYTYYRGECNESCLTVKLTNEFTWNSSVSGIQVLKLLGYKIVTDLQVDKNPEILQQYDKVIVLHNEYVTKREFDAITSHPRVIYLYPNALYAEVIVINDNTITLIRGHNYPDPSIRNGFDWPYDNSIHEYDTDCSNMIFSTIPNGIMLNCYPEHEMPVNPDLLRKIKEF